MYLQNGPGPAEVTVSTIDAMQAISLQPNEVRKMSFDTLMFPIDGPEGKAIRVESSVEIQVLVFKETYFDTDLLSDVYEVPNADVNALQFVTSGYNNGECNDNNYANQFYIVTTVYDDTTITIQPQNDSPVEVVLPSFGTFTTVSFDETDYIADGTLITSDAPITVISGVLCEWNPDSWGAYISSIPTINNLANHYIIPNLSSQNPASPGFSLQVVATESSTTVELDGNVVELDSVGNSVTFELGNSREWMTLNCSKNCLAVQYTKTVASVPSYGMFMLPVLGVREFYQSTMFATLDVSSQSYISIVVQGEAPGTDILLNGDSLGDLDWGTIDGYATAETSIDQGTYVMESVNGRPFMVYIYCHWIPSNSYSGGAGYTRFGNK